MRKKRKLTYITNYLSKQTAFWAKVISFFDQAVADSKSCFDAHPPFLRKNINNIIKKSLD